MGYLRRSAIFWLCLSPLVVIILFPFAVMISTAIRPRTEILVFPPVWLPKEIRLQNFVDMWRAAGFGPALVNSALVSAGATALCLIIAIPAAYATSRMVFRGRRLFRQFLLVTQMLSPIVLVLNFINVFNSFPLIWVMTQGDPANSTDILVTWLYKLAFRYGKLDVASALSIVMFLILLAFTIVYAVLAMRNEREAG